MVEKDLPEVVLISEDELIMEKIAKYHPGAGPGIMGSLPLDEHLKIHQEILNDWWKKGYINTSYRLLGPNRRLFYIFTKIPIGV